MTIFPPIEQRFGLPGGILDALWAQESGRGRNMLNPSSKAAGHFQIIPKNYQSAGIDPYDLGQSALWTAEYAKRAMERFPEMDPVEAIAAHHYGGPNTEQWGPRTRRYIEDIKKRMGSRTIPASDFPQFSPEQMAATMQPVSAPYPGMSSAAQSAAAAPQPNPLTALAVDPLFQAGMSMIAAGTSGRDLGTALQVGMTDAFRNRLLMDQIGERREQTAYERQAAAEQAQWEREKFERQEALAERKIGLGIGLPQQPEVVRIARRLFPDDEEAQRDFILRKETETTKPPSGYRWTDETRTAVEPVPGITKPPTESERMTRTYYDSMRNAEKTIAGIENAPQLEGGFAGAWAAYGPNFLQSEASQEYRQAARQWIRAKLRKESGAAIGRDEELNEYRTYFPVPGDSEAVIEQKRAARQQAAESLLHQAGRAAPSSEEGVTTSDGWTIERE